MANLVGKTVNLDLVGIDGNAFSVIGQFRKQARREGWSNEEIKTVIDKATNGDYNTLLGTILEHCN